MHSKVELQVGRIWQFRPMRNQKVPNNPVKCPKMTNKSDEDYIEHGV